MITQTRECFDRFCKPSIVVDRSDKTSETKHQSKIIEWLEGIGFMVVKIITANKAGAADLICTSLDGQTWKIEVKRTYEKPSKLQKIKLLCYWNNKAVCMVAYGFEDFKYKFNILAN